MIISQPVMDFKVRWSQLFSQIFWGKKLPTTAHLLLSWTEMAEAWKKFLGKLLSGGHCLLPDLDDWEVFESNFALRAVPPWACVAELSFRAEQNHRAKSYVTAIWHSNFYTDSSNKLIVCVFWHIYSPGIMMQEDSSSLQNGDMRCSPVK